MSFRTRRISLHAPVFCLTCKTEITIGMRYFANGPGYEWCEKCCKKPMSKPNLERCGACGEFQSDPKDFTEEEQFNAILVHCGCENEAQLSPMEEWRMMYEAGGITKEQYERGY